MRIRMLSGSGIDAAGPGWRAAMGRYLGRLGGHEGFGAWKLADGSVTGPGSVEVTDFVAYVAACSCSGPDGVVTWLGPSEYPPTDAGERAAVDEWEQLHARYLLTTSRQPAVARAVSAMLTQLDAMTVESPVAMITELRRVQHRSSELLALAVSHARVAGASWAQIAEGLGVSEQDARRRFGTAPGGSSDEPAD
jgi:hypothetical protein